MKNQECKQCGKCCTKGGPAFHFADKDIIVNGTIQAKHLFTIRKGELAFDNVIGGGLKPTKSEIIKIKGVGNTWTCIFLNKTDNHCKIYKNRPIECKILKCWDTKEIQEIYDKQRLSRKDILSDLKDIWELITDHESHCSYYEIKKLAHTFKVEKNHKAWDDILEIIGYDAALRNIVYEKRGIDKDIMNFLFGRPISVTISGFGIVT